MENKPVNPFSKSPCSKFARLMKPIDPHFLTQNQQNFKLRLKKRNFSSSNILPEIYSEFKSSESKSTVNKPHERKYVSYSSFTNNFFCPFKANSKNESHTSEFSSKQPERLMKNVSHYISSEGFEKENVLKCKSFYKINNITEKLLKKQGKTVPKEYLLKLQRRAKSLDKIEKKYQIKKQTSFQDINSLINSIKISNFEENKKQISNHNKHDIFYEFQSPEKNIDKLLKNFFQRKVLKSKYLSHYFMNKKDLNKIITSIGNVLVNNILKETGENFLLKEKLRNIHKNLNISNEDFDLFKGLLSIIMREMSYSEDLIVICLQGLERVREFIVQPKTFQDIFPASSQDNKILIKEISFKIMNNLTLSWYFSNISSENMEIHQKKIMQMIFGTIPYVSEENNLYKFYHKNLDITFFEFFDLKNIILNSLLNIHNTNIHANNMLPISFSPEIERVFKNVEKTRKLLLANPTRDLENVLNIKLLSEILSKRLLEDKEMQQLFSAFSFEKLMKHSETILKYIFNFSSNKYVECDLIPAHCKSDIKLFHFSKIEEKIKGILSELKIKQEMIRRALQNLQMTKPHICKEKSTIEKFSKASFINPCIDHIYVNLFGDPLTKKYFMNADGNYVKYKQKLFFCRMFKNKVGSHDFDDLKAIHARLNISKEEFDKFIVYLQSYLANLQTAKDEEDEIVKEIRKFEPYIICKK